MFSKTGELAGLAAVAVAIAFWSVWEAGLLFGGLSLLLIGATTDDAQVTASLRRGWGWVRYAYWKQIARESGISVPVLPRLAKSGLRSGWVYCECGGQDECPLCDGSGVLPDPEYRENHRSPHPPIRVDPESKVFWERAARNRRRGRG